VSSGRDSGYGALAAKLGDAAERMAWGIHSHRISPPGDPIVCRALEMFPVDALHNHLCLLEIDHYAELAVDMPALREALKVAVDALDFVRSDIKAHDEIAAGQVDRQFMSSLRWTESYFAEQVAIYQGRVAKGEAVDRQIDNEGSRAGRAAYSQRDRLRAFVAAVALPLRDHDAAYWTWGRVAELILLSGDHWIDPPCPRFVDAFIDGDLVPLLRKTGHEVGRSGSGSQPSS
jgi:hypothetical protein